MSPASTTVIPQPFHQVSGLNAWGEAINQAIKRFSDKDWNYTRLTLIMRNLNEISAPYVLGIDWLDVREKQGQLEYRTILNEITWGARHSNELGLLEIVSLRLNHALSEVSADEYWRGIRPVVRLQKRVDLLETGQTYAFWYRAEEVEGEEFENR